MSVEWRLRCADDGVQIGQFRLERDTAVEWSIPESCPFQWLELHVAASEVDSSKAQALTPVILNRAND